MIKAIYIPVSSCVKLSNNSNISDVFNVAIGLKQGLIYLHDIK